MTRVLIKAVLFSFFVLLSYRSSASHMMGAEITWTQTAKDTYSVVVTAYRDCNGILLSNNPLTIENSSGGVSSISGTLSPGIDVTPVSKGHCDRCSDPSCSLPYGIQQYKNYYTVSFKGVSGCDFWLAWQLCCRNGAITTGGSSAGFEAKAYLNRCVKGNNNSPSFIYPAQQLACKNLCSILSNTALPGGKNVTTGVEDSLAYSMVWPMQDDKTFLPFISGYTYRSPVRYAGYPDSNASWDKGCQGFHLDSSSGVIKFKATRTDITNYAIQVTSYRKDSTGKPQIVSTVERDVELFILDCDKATTSEPTLSGVNGTGYTKAYVMAGDTTCFTFYTNDSNATDTVKLNYKKSINWATYTPQTGVKHPTFTFCLHPDSTDISPNPYYFTLEAYADQYPLKGYIVNTYEIYVIKKAAFGFAVNDSVQCLSQDNFVFTNTSKDTMKYAYTWDFGDGSATAGTVNAKHKYAKTGAYLAKMVVSYKGLPLDSTTIMLHVLKDPKADFYTADSNVCGNSTTVHFTNKSLQDTDYTKYEWSFGDGYYTLAHNPVHTYSKYGTYTVTLVAAISKSCIDSFSRTIVIANKPQTVFEVNKDSQCLAYNTFLFNNKTNVSGNAVYSWDFGDSATDNSKSSVHAYKHAGTYTVKLKVVTVKGCDSEYAMKVVVNPTASVGVISGDTIVNAGDSTKYSISAVVGRHYGWRTDKSVNSISPDSGNSIYVKWNSTDTIGTLKAWISNAPDGCTDTAKLVVHITQPNSISETANPYGLVVYPNPTSGNLHIEFDAALKGQSVLHIRDITGRELYSREIPAAAGRHTENISLEGYAKGIYFLDLSGSKGYSVSKVMVE